MTFPTHRSLPLSLCLVPLAALALLFLAPISANASVCNGFYPGSFSLAQGKLNPATPALAKPAKGARFREPSFGTCLVRATAHAVEPPNRFARNDYSRRQAFNADNTYFLIYSDGGTWNLYNANTLQYVRQLTPLAGDAEPQWHPTNPNVLYYLPINGGTKLMKVDVRTNASSVVVDFVGKLPAWAASAVHIWTHSEGAPSADGRYWGFIAYNSNWDVLGYIVWDIQQNKLVGSRKDSATSLDNASISALGRWFITTGKDVWAWSPDFSQKKKLANVGGVHSDMGIGANGNDVFLSVDFQSNDGDIYFVDLDSCPSVSASASTAPVCPRTVLFSMYKDGGWATPHFSMKAFDKPGWALISMYDAASNTGTLPWFRDKVMAVQLAASPKIHPLAHARRVPVTSGDTDGASNYWSEPHASVNRDFTRVIYNTNWGNSVGVDIDAYIIELPATALSGGIAGPRTGGKLPPLRGNGGSNAAAAAAALPSSAVDVTDAGTPTYGSLVFTLGCNVCKRVAQVRSSWSAYASEAIWQTRTALAMTARMGRSLLVGFPPMVAREVLDYANAAIGVSDNLRPADLVTTGNAGNKALFRSPPSQIRVACVSTHSPMSAEADFLEPMSYRLCRTERSYAR